MELTAERGDATTQATLQAVKSLMGAIPGGLIPVDSNLNHTHQKFTMVTSHTILPVAVIASVFLCSACDEKKPAESVQTSSGTTTSVSLGLKSPVAKYFSEMESLEKKLAALAAQPSVTSAEYEALMNQYGKISEAYTNEIKGMTMAQIAAIQDEGHAWETTLQKINQHMMVILPKLKN